MPTIHWRALRRRTREAAASALMAAASAACEPGPEPALVHGGRMADGVVPPERSGGEGEMVAKSETAPDRGSVWSWPRTREAVMVLAAVVASFGVLIAGVTYAVQPLREDVRALQATMGDVRERLVRLEEGQARLEKDVARVLVLLERAPGG